LLLRLSHCLGLLRHIRDRTHAGCCDLWAGHGLLLCRPLFATHLREAIASGSGCPGSGGLP
jgi:hypothetical protein